jgi:hypothetical protein
MPYFPHGMNFFPKVLYPQTLYVAHLLITIISLLSEGSQNTDIDSFLAVYELGSVVRVRVRMN